MELKTKKLLLIFLAFFLAIIIYHNYGYIGHYGYDDMGYAKISNDLTKGIVDYNNHFTYRHPIIFLTALCYSVFGVNDFASSIPPIITTITILLFVLLSLKDKSLFTITIALSITLFSNWFIFYSDKMMPDIYVALGIVAALYFLHKYKYHTNQNHPHLYAFLFSFSLFMGFLAKETILLTIPLLIYFVVLDFVKKRHIAFWMYSLIFGALLFGSYCAIIGLLTGNPFKRFDAITQNGYLNLCSYDQQPVVILVKRISYEFIQLFIAQSMCIGFIFVIAFGIQKNIKTYFHLNDSFSFYFISAIILLFSSNFMTVSATSYSPMCLDVRHYLFLMPVFAIPASIIITDFVTNKRHSIAILFTLIIICMVSYFIETKIFWKLYFPLTILFFAFYFFKRNKALRYLFLIVFVVISMVTPYDMIAYASKVNYWEQKEIIKQIILKNNSPCIITDPVQKRLCDYYTGFNPAYSNKIIAFDEQPANSAVQEGTIYYANWYTQYLSGIGENDLPNYIKNIDQDNSLFYENTDLNIAAYRLKKINNITGIEIVNSNNNFESDIAFWSQNQTNTTKDIKYEGESSWVMNEYSSAFTYSLDSIVSHNFHSLLISGKVYCKFDDKTKAQIVFSIKTPEGQYVWKSVEINKYIVAYSNWCPVKYDFCINKNALKINSTLNIYVWNPEKQKGNIDNFSVQILGMN